MKGPFDQRQQGDRNRLVEAVVYMRSKIAAIP